MEPIILDNITFEINARDLAPKLYVEPDTEDYNTLESLIAEACRIARPKAVYTTSIITDCGSDFVTLDGVRMISPTLSANLKGLQQVYPYVTTCGTEVEEWSKNIGDMLYQWWMDAVKLQMLQKAADELNSKLKESLNAGKLSQMNPGTLQDWPIAAQRDLFSLFGDVKAHIGVTLTDSMLMLPSKSVSGIYYKAE
jgi:hypothetical protein